MKKILTPLLVLALAACAAPETPPADDAEADAPEAVSLLGTPLHRTDFGPERRAELEADLEAARAAYEADPDDADAIIWLGRRLAYLWRYRDAVEVFTEGIEKHPADARLYRHRGHRYITLRRFDDAVADLERAAALIEGTPDEVEPDGQPNAAGIPTSTLHTNVYYHLGLAHYLRGDYERALEAFERCLVAAGNNDMRVATLDWVYMTLRRLGRHGEARALLGAIHPDMELLENHAYHRRLLLYKGVLPPDSLLAVAGTDAEDRALTLATQGYGVGNYFLAEGDTARAHALFEEVVAGRYWPAFGYLAAEADLAR
ncbi:MAG: tetratricopeptide repeat protein [Rhodothermales bacterium]|nr:tetratricopeptide repeat protein [Rhodothermales bacterium]